MAAGDPRALAVWREAIDALADGLVTGITLLDPRMLIIGGGLAEAGDTLFGPLRAAVEARITFQKLPLIVPAALGDTAGCLGAGLLAWDLTLRGGNRLMAPVTTTQRTVLAGARVVLPSGVVDGGRITVEGTRIAANAPAGAEAAAATVDLAGHTVVPGFVDIHNHGGGGASFTSGTARGHPHRGPHPPRARHHHRRRLHRHRRAATTWPGRPALLSELVEQGDLAGIHYEGPFISPCRKGAHDEDAAARPRPGRRPQAGRGRPRRARRWSRSPPNCPAASTPYGCSPTSA